MSNKNSVKLGTVGSHNRALRALTQGGVAYITDEYLNEFAQLHPRDYLRHLERVTEMVRKGPAFSLYPENVLTLSSIYFEPQGNKLCAYACVATFRKTADGWMLAGANDGKVDIPESDGDDGDDDGAHPESLVESVERYYTVPVVYEMYGSISVAAKSPEEAYDKVKGHPEDYDLPDEGFYVDDSFRVSDDDRENAVETIRMLSGDDGDDSWEPQQTAERIEILPESDGEEEDGKRLVELTDGTHIEYASLIAKAATCLFVMVSHRTLTGHLNVYFSEVEDALLLPEGTVDEEMARDVLARLEAMFPGAVAEAVVEMAKDGDEIESRFDVTLYHMWCLGYVGDDQCVEENRQDLD